MKMNNFDLYLNEYFENNKSCLINDAMKYAIIGGKHFRPRIIFALLKDLNLDESLGYDAALALEMIHTYSLIHDDLPAMDNDDFRRGKASVHKQFGEDIAILSGDELLTESFGVIADSYIYSSEIKVKLISLYSKYAGLNGMVYGQLLDISNTNNNLDQNLLEEIHDNKTGGLFKISCLAPMYIGGLNNEEYFINLGKMIGSIFQKQDDLFEITKTKQEMGKNLSDLDNNKLTALSLYSKDELIKNIDDAFNELDDYLNVDFIHADNLKQLLLQLKNR